MKTGPSNAQAAPRVRAIKPADENASARASVRSETREEDFYTEPERKGNERNQFISDTRGLPLRDICFICLFSVFDRPLPLPQPLSSEVFVSLTSAHFARFVSPRAYSDSLFPFDHSRPFFLTYVLV